MSAPESAFELRGLRVSIGGTAILNGVDLSLPQGASLGFVGQSGSGKSMTAKALAGLLPGDAEVSGEYLLAGEPVELDARSTQWRRIRGPRVVWLPQDPFTSLDPMRRCGEQVIAAHPRRRSLSAGQRHTEVISRLREVGLAERVASAYPHELSGGMRQRVAIAAALAPDPHLLLADEPTTALDVSTQAGILDLLAQLRAERGMSTVLITHDLMLARERCELLAVFHAGEVVEAGPAKQLVHAPAHEVTRELIAIGLGTHAQTDAGRAGAKLLAAERISKTYPGADAPALIEADIEVGAGEIVGIVGESGSGKTTLARCLLGLEEPDQGGFAYIEDGQAVPWSPRQAQLVFQNPYASLNPSMTVRATLVEALRSAGRPASDLSELLALVELDAELVDRRPARLSGGERQRVAIARALAPRPRVLFCDEAVSALDAPVQAKILATLVDLRDRLGLSIVFITHDLRVVEQVAQRVYVVFQGRIVESGRTSEVLNAPQHAYTAALIESIPRPPVDSVSAGAGSRRSGRGDR